MRTVITLSDRVASGRSTISLERRLKKYTSYQSDCWIWTGTKSGAGHGQIRINYRLYTVSRISAHIYLNLDLDNLNQQSNHKPDKCNNPACWNPEHLYVGTQGDNVKDKQKFPSTRSGRKNKRKTHCPRGHEYNQENTSFRNRRRHCKVCSREKAKELRMRRRVVLSERLLQTVS